MISISEAFVDIATDGGQHVLRTVFIKENLFHQSELGRDVELLNRRIVLVESPRHVMQVTTLGAQLRLRQELVD